MRSKSLWGALLAVSVLVLVFLSMSRHCKKDTGDVPKGAPEETDTLAAAPAVPLYAKALLEAYPDFVCGYEDGSLLFRDGTTMACDDGLEKDYLQRLDETDIEDMFVDIYPMGSPSAPEYLCDPGRFRCEAFFKKMYGDTEARVRTHLVQVDWFGQRLPFTEVNHAADSLKATEKELKALLPQSEAYFQQSSTFYWRKVRGAERLSAHSYGMTIDICVKYSDFWRWSNPGKEEMDEIVYKNRIPAEIVRIFEKHGFISGTKWYHYDTMHFEFRPDLLLYSGYMAECRSSE